ncbi:MAG: chemotaxis protein CheR [Deltaproteobacteria bacterium RBG_16_71_12]|nr:MAG: chemotaxis protein CheR [Deltaproteobacteria bacterium RBG_16_71_12]
MAARKSKKRAPEPTEPAPFPVVGIGASAGGLAAFQAFFAGMPTDAPPAMAFVLVQHLAPDHKSVLAELIKRSTTLQVFEVEDGMQVRPGCAYIIPPNRDMALAHGHLKLLEPTAPRGMRLPIDFFFRSLADDQRERAIGVVLSGTGSDGAEGVRAIKAAGGTALAQLPTSTEFDGMPRAAVATGLIDYVLAPETMPAQLIAFAAAGRTARVPAPQTEATEASWRALFGLLNAHTGHDFSKYKPNAIARRVERRMALARVSELGAYVDYLRTSAGEVDELFRELLIGVTGFFRDPNAFAALEAKVLPRLFSDRAAGGAVRAWVPGCATGEEAYTLAMLLQEQADLLEHRRRFLVFATDIDGRAIKRARTGVFPAGIAAYVTPERLARFFVREPNDAGYRVKKELRDSLVFSEQDVIKDPPFSNLDLICCRNVMIYLGAELQRRLIPQFHYALRPGGFLFLGTSETVGEFADLFETVDTTAKLYRRRPDDDRVARPTFGGFGARRPVTEASPPTPRREPRGGNTELRQLVEAALLAEYGAVGALVTERGEVLYLHGRSGEYLEPATGEASLDILAMAREGLRRELASALHRAASEREAVRRPAVRVTTRGSHAHVDLTVRPLSPRGVLEREGARFLVILSATREPAPAQAAAATDAHQQGRAPELRAEVEALQAELRDQELYLRAANDALRSTNEEMQSVNEELQSTNEELETSKEELQSVNEELATVNNELQAKVTDLSRANNDMANLLSGTGIGTIFVDHKLRILRFTPTVTQVINLIPSDIGRSVGDIVANLVGYERLANDVRTVLDTLVPIELEVQTRAGTWHLLRIRPYRTQDNVIEGVVVTFTDITELRKARDLLRESAAERRLAAVVVDSHDAITLLDLDGHLLAWNPAAERMYGWKATEVIGTDVRALVPEGRRATELDSLQKAAGASPIAPYRTRRLAKDGRLIAVSIIATALRDGTTRGVYALATTEREVVDET